MQTFIPKQMPADFRALLFRAALNDILYRTAEMENSAMIELRNKSLIVSKGRLLHETMSVDELAQTFSKSSELPLITDNQNTVYFGPPYEIGFTPPPFAYKGMVKTVYAGTEPSGFYCTVYSDLGNIQYLMWMLFAVLTKHKLKGKRRGKKIGWNLSTDETSVIGKDGLAATSARVAADEARNRLFAMDEVKLQKTLQWIDENPFNVMREILLDVGLRLVVYSLEWK